MPSHRRGAVVDDRVLNATLEVIAEFGSMSIRVDDVAAAAGVNKTTIYRRYPTRDELVLAAVLGLAEQTIPTPDSGALETDLVLLCEAVRDTITAPLGRALLSAGGHLDEQIAKLRRDFWTARFDASTEILRRAADRGEILMPARGAEIIEIMVAPLHFRAQQVGGDIDDDFIAELVRRSLVVLAA